MEPDRTNRSGRPPRVDLGRPTRVLAIGAHPDDVEFGCGATLAKWAASGAEVHLLVLTDGSKGSWDAGEDPARLAARRRGEQAEAARVLGARAVHHLGAVDGALADGPAEQAAVCEVIRATRPGVVLAHDPWKRYRLHPDHRRAGELVVDALVAARDPHFFPEQLRDGRLQPHRPESLLLFEAEDLDHVEDVGAHLETKVLALLCHRSQWRSTMGIEAGSPGERTQREAFGLEIRRRAAAAGALAGVDAGEVFKRLDDL